MKTVGGHDGIAFLGAILLQFTRQSPEPRCRPQAFRPRRSRRATWSAARNIRGFDVVTAQGERRVPPRP